MKSVIKFTHIPNINNYKKFYFYIIFLAAILRAAWIYTVPMVPYSDAKVYDLFARNLASGYGYAFAPGNLTAYWPPGTSFIYSLCYRLFGFSYLPIGILNLLFSVAIVALTMDLCNLWFGRDTAAIAGILLAICPAQIGYTTLLLSELPFTFFLLLSLFVWSNPKSKPLRRSLMTGVLLSALSYIRPTALLLPFVFGLSGIIKTKNYIKLTAMIALMTIVMIAMIAPWSIRNTRLFGQFTLISTNGGSNLWMGNNPNSTGFYQSPSKLTSEYANRANEAKVDYMLGTHAKNYILRHPFKFITRTLIKFIRLHERETVCISFNKGLDARCSTAVIRILKISATVYWLVLLSLGIAGGMLLFVKMGFWPAITHPVIMIWVYFSLVYSIVVIDHRYKSPYVPMVAILASLAVNECYVRTKFKGHSRKTKT